ncbi:MAG: hypothetical protein L6R28_17870 [Planctomycetes bacterium]|nr:hypothetical protein [Planctomycetota bacterium]
MKIVARIDVSIKGGAPGHLEAVRLESAREVSLCGGATGIELVLRAEPDAARIVAPTRRRQRHPRSIQKGALCLNPEFRGEFM